MVQVFEVGELGEDVFVAMEFVRGPSLRTWLDETLRVKRQVIDNYLFVSQLQMFNFIDQTPTERSETFSHLCGTTYMQKIYEALGERIKADLPLSADVVDNSDELRQQIGEAKKKRRTATPQVRHHAGSPYGVQDRAATAKSACGQGCRPGFAGRTGAERLRTQGATRRASPPGRLQ